MFAIYKHWHAMTQRVANSDFATRTLPPMLTTVGNYAELMRLHKPIGIFLLLWPTLWALWLASYGRPNEQVFAVFVLGVLLTRSAGCVINDFADRDFDARVQRTKDRPLANKRLEPAEAIIVFVALSLIAVALVLTLDRTTQWLAAGGAAMIITYPFFKRFFALPQAYLGAAFSWSIPMAYAAQTGSVPRLAWLLFIANILWTTAYDTMYAMVDRADDVKIGIKSSGILFGDADCARKVTSRVQQDLVPLNAQQLPRDRGAALRAAYGRQLLEVQLQLGDAWRHLDVEGIRVEGVALPVQQLPVGVDLQARQGGGIPIRPMCAG